MFMKYFGGRLGRGWWINMKNRYLKSEAQTFLAFSSRSC